jgi:HEPN domain-containing protein
MIPDLVQKWLEKAEHDLKIGGDELLTENPATDMICFHMQQGVEKYLKAFLVFRGAEIQKTHNLSLIIEDCSALDTDFRKLFALNTDRLTDYAVEARYPDDFYMPTTEETRKAQETALAVKRFVLDKIRE